jgi:hypothetical protein
MRCPSCEKFVPYSDEPEVELLGEADEELEVSVSLTCGECGDELRSGNLTLSPSEPAEHGKADCDGEFEVDGEITVDPTVKEIKKKLWYGARVSYAVHCSTCDTRHEFVLSDSMLPSDMDEV